jgi:hypothetical protein
VDEGEKEGRGGLKNGMWLLNSFIFMARGKVDLCMAENYTITCEEREGNQRENFISVPFNDFNHVHCGYFDDKALGCSLSLSLSSYTRDPFRFLQRV